MKGQLLKWSSWAASLADRDWSWHWHCVASTQSRGRGQSHGHTGASQEAAVCNLMPGVQGTTAHSRLVSSNLSEVTYCLRVHKCNTWNHVINRKVPFPDFFTNRLFNSLCQNTECTIVRYPILLEKHLSLDFTCSAMGKWPPLPLNHSNGQFLSM